MTKIRTLAFAGLAMIASIGAASASQISPARFHAAYQAQNLMTAMYGHSGSIGRLNYGANVFHPEGPANFSD